jgi:hypothetical protein
MVEPTKSPAEPRQGERGALRLFFKDETTGSPVAGVVVSLHADFPRHAEMSTDERRLIATLQTNRAGYVSFKLVPGTLAGRTRLSVTHGAQGAEAREFRVAELLAAGGTHTIRVDASALVTDSSQPVLPSVMFPDAEDALVSPASIGMIPRLEDGRGLCGQLMPTTMAVRRFRAFQVVADLCAPHRVSCTGDEGVEVVMGKVLEYEVAWNPLGAALGELLNSISLAPCEQVNIAVVDWMRRETGTLDQTSDVSQASSQRLDHDRLITESMQSSTKSSSWGVAGGVKAGKKIGTKIDLSATISGGIGKSSADVASFVASQHNTSVFQATASEHRTYQTRTIRNHNHCHTLNLTYYQVNTSYEVVTEYRGEREAVLVRYPVRDFDAERAYCNAEVLKAALLDPALLGCFDELAGALFCCDIKPPPPASTPGDPVLMDSLTITVRPKDVGNGVWRLYVSLYSATSPSWQPLSTTGSVNINPYWQSGGVHTQTFNLYPPVDPAQVAWMDLSLVSSNQQPAYVVLSDIQVTYHVVNDGSFTFYAAQGVTIHPKLVTPVQPVLPGQQQTSSPPASARNECVESSCCIQRLLGHLNCHERYYNCEIWLNEDPNDRIMRWACCYRDLQKYDLIGRIENDPVTVYGDYLVFQVAGSPLVADPSVLPVRELVTMPTPGVYAEGILGKCDTCEITDPDRFWNWKDSPCGDNAPPVDEPPAPQAGVKPGDLKADLIGNLITFGSVPGAPDSVLKNLISALVSSADAGSSEASTLLGKLLDAVKEALKPPTPAPTGSGTGSGSGKPEGN